jgi:hypothetical protein
VALTLLTWTGAAVLSMRPRAGRPPFRACLGFSAALTWLWLVLGWSICGITYIIYLLVSDACVALPLALDNPSSLSRTVPCLDPAFQAAAASDARAPVFNLVNGTNSALAACTPQARGPIARGLLCNPYAATADASGDFVFTDADAATACASPYNVTLPQFSTAYTSSSCPVLAVYPPSQPTLPVLAAGAAAAQALVTVMPAVDALTSCAFIRGTMNGARGKCPVLEKGARTLFGGLLLADIALSLLLMLSVHAFRSAGAHAQAGEAPTLEIDFSVPSPTKEAV